jgi:uncharacterized protein YukE
MNNIGKNVDSMNFEELRSFVKVLANDVQELSDLYAKTKREYNDMLYNLSRDNLSIEYIAEQESMFEQTENGLKSVIAKNIASLRKLTDKEKENATPVNSFEEMTDKSLIYKMPLTDNPNKFTYFCYYAPLDMWVPINEVDQQKYSTIEQTAEKIATSVRETKQYVDDMLGDVELDEYTTIEQTAQAITQTAYRGINLSEAIEISGEEFLPDEYDGNEYFISHDGFGSNSERTYYAYNYALGKYMPILDGQSIYTVFKQTADKFEFLGNVIIDGSLITQGEIKGISVYASKNNTDQSVALIAGNGYEAYIQIGSVGVIKPSVLPAQMIISSKAQGADMLIESETLRFNCTNVEGLGVVPVFG